MNLPVLQQRSSGTPSGVLFGCSLKKLICLFLFFLVGVLTAFSQVVPYSKNDLRKVIRYIHQTYRSDYTSTHNQQTLDWQKASVAMMYVHAYELLGDAQYLKWASDALYVEFNISDDQCWGANALLELSRHGVKAVPQPYTNDAGKTFKPAYSYQDIFDLGLTTQNGTAPAPYTGFYDAPESGGAGGICWSKAFTSYNTCTLGQAIVLAYLMPEQSVNGKSPREFASLWMNLQNELLLDAASGKVYDNYQLPAKSKNSGNYSYNNGTVLAALGLAWMKDSARHADAPALADKLVDYVLSVMTRDGALYSPDADFSNRNAHAFNGIFMHFLPYYLFADLPSRNKAKLKAYTQGCASIVWKQIMDNQKLHPGNYGVSYSWTEAYSEAQTNCMTSVSGAECLLTSYQIAHSKKPVVYSPKRKKP